MSDTFSAIAGSGAGGAYVAGDKFGYQTAEKIRQDLNVLVTRRAVVPLGGSRNHGVQHTSVLDAYDYLDIEIDGTALSGMTVQARVECRVASTATVVTPKVRNVTDSTDAGLGLSCSATNSDYSGTNQKQTISVSVASGIKKYRLMLTPSNNSFQLFAIGYLEIYR